MLPPLRVIIFFAGLGLLLIGIQHTWAWLTLWDLQHFTCEQYQGSGASAKWLELTDCNIEYSSVVKISKKAYGAESDISYYAPVRCNDLGESKTKTKLVIRAPKEVTTKLAMVFDDGQEAVKNDAAAMEKRASNMIDIQNQASQSSVVRGMILRGFDSDSETRRRLDSYKRDWQLSDDWEIVDPELYPSLSPGIFQLLGGALILAGQLGYWLLHSQDTPENKSGPPRIKDINK